MGKTELQIKAMLTNVDKFYPYDRKQFSWPIKVKCTGCGEDSPNWHTISQDVIVELPHSTVNFMYKCKCCNRENNLSICENVKINLKRKAGKNPVNSNEYTSEDDGQFRGIVVFECRGLEVTSFVFSSGWAAESGRKKFTDVDFTEGDWCEYNELDDVPVEISGLEYQFVNIK